MSQDADTLYGRLDGWLEKMVELQREKVLRVAREIDPHVTAEDIRNPQDLPKLMADQTFNFEDGTLAGLISARIALRAEYHRSKDED